MSATLRLRYSSGDGRFKFNRGAAGTSWMTDDMVGVAAAAISGATVEGESNAQDVQDAS
jgi:hypothetical protein